MKIIIIIEPSKERWAENKYGGHSLVWMFS
jgi:hypothetical protein